MTAKLFGSLLLVGAGLYIALLLARYEHRRVGVLDGYLSLLRFIRGQIDCFSMPIGQILATVDPSVLAACRGQDRASAGRPAASLPLLLHESRGYLGGGIRTPADLLRARAGAHPPGRAGWTL